MSERKRRGDGSPLPLPTPRPDHALDEKILAYARVNAPRRQAPRPARWVAGLATAGIVAAAVMITLPGQPPAPMQEAPEKRAIDAAADLDSEDADAGVLADFAQPRAAKPGEAQTPAGLRQQLEAYGEMLRSGEETQARQHYRRLREKCGDCQLPETLEGALQKYLLED